MTESSRIVVAGDSRAAERALLEALSKAFQPPGPGIARRVFVVVPSRNLRTHLQSRLLEERPAWLGIRVATLRATAETVLLRAGEKLPRGAALAPVLIERAASRRRTLAEGYSEFAGGWGALAAAAHDLTDAGFEPAHAPALLDRIASERGALPERTLMRAEELVDALAEALEELDQQGLAPDAALYRRASARVAEEGASALGAGAIFVHGFADATGVATDLLEALVRHSGAVVVLPSTGHGPESAHRFGVRLRERLESAGDPARFVDALRPAALSVLVSASPELEARSLARIARAEIDRGLPPERIGIVYRDLAGARSELARELERRCVPFSATSASGPLSPTAQRARALSRLLGDGAEAPLDVALDGLRDDPRLAAEHRTGVRLAFRSLGWVRLRDVPDRLRQLPGAGPTGFPLPVRAGIETTEDGAEIAPRRRVPTREIRIAAARLRGVRSAIRAWPRSATWSAYLGALERLLRAALPGVGANRDALRDAARGVAADVPLELELTGAEALSLLDSAWGADGRLGWGGAGGGVQVLSVTEARGCTFDILLLGGLARGRFPRPIVEEPLLPDTLRARLRELLPDLPVKREGHDEEAFLFAQLLGAADVAILSRPAQDEDGRLLPVSPLLEAIERDRVIPAHAPDSAGPVPALERAVGRALHGREAALAPVLAPALEEARQRFAPEARFDALATADARLRALDEYDSSPATLEGRRRISALGPFFGLVGARDEEQPIAATTLERHAACAWQNFLERSLQVEPTPDPIEALPWIDSLLLGSAVHDTLAELFGGAGGASGGELEARLESPGVELRWPAEPLIREVVRSVATRVLADAGLVDRGLERPLEQRVVERLEIVRELDAASPADRVLGSELDGSLRLASADERPFTVRFRADRIQREPDRVVLIDFKTGGVPPGLDAKQEKTRRANLLSKVRSGERLQAAIYAAALAPRPAQGRYVFLRPNDDPPTRVLGLEADDETRAALEAAAATIVRSRRFGASPPRLLEQNLTDEYEGCQRCRVAEACVRGDSGFRGRLRRWHALQAGREGVRTPIEEALWRLWRLPAKPEAPGR